MQRIGRVDRRTNPEVERRLIADHPEVADSRGKVSFWNFLPPDELNALLSLYTKVTQKTPPISRTLGIEGRVDVEIDCLKRRFAGGSVLATACSGAILLAEAGLLDGEEATTHWAYCDVVAKRYPKVKMRPKRALVVTGDGGRLVMAGGGTSWLDLALYLIARCTDVETAMQCARINLIDWHDIGQQPFARLARTRQVDDAIVARCQTRIASIGWSVDEALTFVLSGGTTAPERIRLNRREGRSPDPRSTPPAASGGQVPAEAGPLAAGPRETRQG